jgi:signal transduction histidine kinase
MDRNQQTFPGSSQSQQTVSDLTNALERSQSAIEEEKVALVRMLHDDFGGLLVGAIMDIGWLSQQAGHSELEREKLARATGLLRAAIDMKRELIENLRPTLLDNVGLFSTLRWHMKARCDAAGVPYSVSFPAYEMAFPSEFKIVVFRIVQDALKHVLSHGVVRELSLDVEITDDTLHCVLRSKPVEASVLQENERISTETSTRHRAQRIGGTLEWLKTGAVNHIHLQIPVRV